MQKQDIIDKVRTIMNETGSEEQWTLLSEDTVKLDAYIESVIPDAMNMLMGLQEVDPFMMPWSNVSNGSASMEDSCTVVTLPADFLRFVAARCTGWKREVQKIFPYGGEDYKVQHNSVTTAGVNKPSCVYAHSGSAKVVECFPAGSLVYFNYIAKVDSSSYEGSLNLIDGMFAGALCYLCAYIVYNIFEMPNTAQLMYNMALQQIPKL